MEIQPSSPSTHAPADLFTGEVWFDVIAAPPAPARLRANLVRFAPGARTHWHAHPGGQSLRVTQGVARVGTRDGRVVELRPGQTVWCPPGEWHWHGAGPDSYMEHLALWEVDGADAQWGEPVTDEQYRTRTEQTR
ncbi:(R)-mandelonitrile lyase [Cellulomonas denverensis]|uniref:Cupin domain-containing protein n=1 Tax=Cellulomonas denverensis TaxID=264297 RepID=A0A7X6KTU0_9CELL|nr:cupin domain-containing protein [Cellulomonas denverensis]NKY22127.1 cupin domain-containing protein [Cellulomonas denverensis]GIG26112.1 cupin [Cellulomonas denverensis]